MTKVWLGLFLVSLFVVAGCAKPVQFEGKSETWSVVSTIDTSAKMKSYHIRYIAAERQPVKDIRFSFQGSSNFQESGSANGPSKNMTFSGKSTLVAPYAEENGFNLYIKWNGGEETIPLVKK